MKRCESMIRLSQRGQVRQNSEVPSQGAEELDATTAQFWSFEQQCLPRTKLEVSSLLARKSILPDSEGPCAQAEGQESYT